jgi:hypothetical protein
LSRDQERSGRKRLVRASTINVDRLSKRELEKGRLLNPETRESRQLRALRPKTRGECAGGERPCPWVSCAHHLYLDVDSWNGSVKLNFPDLEVSEMRESCALDVADRGETTLEQVGEITNLTRERVRQIEEHAMRKVRRSRSGLRDHVVEDAPIARGILKVRAMSENVRSKTDKVLAVLEKTHGNYLEIAALAGLHAGHVNTILVTLFYQRRTRRDASVKPVVYWLADKPSPQGCTDTNLRSPKWARFEAKENEDSPPSGRPEPPHATIEEKEEEMIEARPLGITQETIIDAPGATPTRFFVATVAERVTADHAEQGSVYDVVLQTLEQKAVYHEEEASKIRAAIDVLRKALL